MGKVGYPKKKTKQSVTLRRSFTPSSCDEAFIWGKKVLPKHFADKIGSDMRYRGSRHLDTWVLLRHA